MVFEERRKHKRIPAEFTVDYVHDGDYLISRSKDISVDGMFIYTEKPPEVGETVKLTFSIGSLRDVTVSGRVVWINKQKSDFDSGMGIQFIDPDPTLQLAVLTILNKVVVDGDDSLFPALETD